MSVRPSRRSRAGWLAAAFTLATGALLTASADAATPPAYAARASMTPGLYYVGDSTGSVYTFTVKNAGASTSIGAVQISRPSTGWTVSSCPTAPTGWVKTASASLCRYRSATTKSDDIKPGASRTFSVKAKTAAGTADRIGTWKVVVSSLNTFDKTTALKTATATTPGLTVRLRTFQVTGVVVRSTAATLGGACPTANKSALFGSTQTIVVCGRNRASVALTPTAAYSALSGTMIGTKGTFSSRSIPARSATVVLANWKSTKITSTAGLNRTIAARVGSASNRTSPPRTFTGYTAYNGLPVAAAHAHDATEDTPLTVAAPGVLAGATDPDNDALVAALPSDPPRGSVTLAPDGSFTYTPDANFHGTDSFTYVVRDPYRASVPATVTITVLPVADPPVAVDDTASTGEGAATAIGVLGNDSDPEGDALSVVALSAPGLAGQVSTDGTVVSYDPNGKFEHLRSGQSATETIDYTVGDGVLTDTGRITVTVTGVDDAPVATDDAYQVVGDTVLDVPAAGVLTNDLDVDGPALSAVDVVQPAHGTVALGTDGGFRYTPAPGYSGPDSFGYAASDGTLKDTAQVAITVVPPNAVPTAGAAGASGVEDGSPVTVQLSGGDPDGEALTFDVGTASNGLVTVPTAVSCTGSKPSSCTATVTYTPNANFHGTDTFTYVTRDSVQASAPATVTMTVTPVNDAPSFTKGANVTVAEDAPAQSVSGWATAISAGPANEAGQTVSFVATTNNDALFTVLPSVSENGTLTYTPAPNAFGAATVSVRVRDSGGTANGGVDQSAIQTFTITVTSVNDAPSFAKGANVTVAEDAGEQSLTGWATAISAGPANESAQTVSFTTENNNNALFSVQPGVTPTGTLVYTPAPNRYGTATVIATLADNGGTANGGDDTADPQTFTITVTPVNDAPVAAAKSFAVQTNMKISLGGLLTGATDPNDVAGNPAWAPTFTVGSITPGAGCVGCTVSNVNLAAGTFDFEPPAGGTGAYTISYTVVDNGHPAPGATSAPQTITLNVSGPVIWFVDPVSGNDLNNGTLTRPFATLTKASTANGSAANHRFFVAGGPQSGITLPAGGWLTGAGAKAPSFDALMGITPPAGTAARPAVNGTAPSISSTVTLGSGNTVRGVQLGGLSGTSFGTLTLGSGASADATVAAPSAQAINLSTGTINGDFANVSSGGGANNVLLNAVGTTTTTSFGTGALTGATVEGLKITGGTGTFAFGGPIGSAGGNPVAISGKTGGTVTLNGLVNDTTGPGISLTNNTGATVNFLGGVTLTSGTSPAFVATGGGTVSVAGSANTLATTTGTPLQVVNTTIGAGDITFRSIAANGAPNGIVLNATGAVGNLAVTGTGTAASGGTIANTTGPAVSLTSTRDVALSHVRLQDSFSDGITGTGVTNLTLTGVEVLGAGDADEERAVDLANMGGALAISGGKYDDAADDLVKVLNTNTNLTLTVGSAATFSNQTQTLAGNAFDLVPNGTSAIAANITGNTFSNLKNTSVNLGAGALGSSGTSSLTFANNTVNGGAQGGAGVVVSGQEATTTTTTITGNGFTGAGGNGVVNHDVNDTSVVLATVQGNTFTSPKGHGIVAAVDEDADLRIRIDGNTISNAGGDGIELVNFGDDSVAAMTSTAHFVVTNNTVNGHSLVAATQFVGGIGVFHFENDADTTCARITGNTVTGTPAGFYDIFLQDQGVSKLTFEEVPDTAATGAVSAAYIQSKNPNTTASKIDNIGAVHSNGVACQNP